MENPNKLKAASAPTSETGTVMAGMSVARQSCRKMKTTMKTRTKASNRVFSTSSMEAVTNSTVSRPF